MHKYKQKFYTYSVTLRIRKMFNFNRHWILRYLRYSALVKIVFLMMTMLYLMSRNVWGEEIFTHKDKQGIIIITNIPPPEKNIPSPQKDITSKTKKSQSSIDLTPVKTSNLHRNLTPARKSKSYYDLPPEERLHWGRDNALNDKHNKGKNGQGKKYESVDTGRYKVKIKKIGINLYQDISTRIIIRTHACAEPAGGEELLLNWSGSSGKIYFKNAGKSCIVENIYNSDL
jgi:hypothetical protein